MGSEIVIEVASAVGALRVTASQSVGLASETVVQKAEIHLDAGAVAMVRSEREAAAADVMGFEADRDETVRTEEGAPGEERLQRNGVRAGGGSANLHHPRHLRVPLQRGGKRERRVRRTESLESLQMTQSIHLGRV